MPKPRHGSEHRDVAIIYKCTAQIHQERNEFDIARQMFEKVLMTGRAALGNFHPEVASTLNKIGKLSYELGDMTSAMSYHTEGLKVERAILEPDHPHIMVTFANIAQIHK
jgi:Tfp pilus assembly protein PilF